MRENIHPNLWNSNNCSSENISTHIIDVLFFQIISSVVFSPLWRDSGHLFKNCILICLGKVEDLNIY